MELDIKLFPTLIRQSFETVKKITKSDDMLIMHNIMGAVSACTSCLYNCDSRQFGQIPINTYLFCIADTGYRKTAIHNLIWRPFDTYEKLRLKEYKDDMQKYKKKYKDYEKELKTDINAIMPPHPEDGNYILKTLTTNGLKDALAYVPFVACVHDDAGAQLSSYAFDLAHKLETSYQLCDSWGDAPITKCTGVEGGRFKYFGRRINVCWASQTDISLSFLNDPLLITTGLMARFNVIQLPKKPQEINKGEYDNQDTVDIQIFWDRIEKLLNKGRPYAQPGQDADFKLANFEPELLLPSLEFEEDAFLETFVLQNNSIKLVDLEHASPALDGYARKLQEHVMRFAAQICVFEGRHKKIQKYHVIAASHLCEHYLQFLTKQHIETKSALVKSAIRLSEWLKKVGPKTKGQMTQSGPLQKDTKEWRDESLSEAMDRQIIVEKDKLFYYNDPSNENKIVPLDIEEDIKDEDNLIDILTKLKKQKEK